MAFTIVVHDLGQANQLAQRFIHAALLSGHRIEQVFFYHEAVRVGDGLVQCAQDDPATPHTWQDLANAGNFELNVCISAALRRGIINVEEAQRYSKPGASLATPFQLVGLGVFIEGLVNADRVVTFAN